MTIRRSKYLIWCVALVVILACVPALPAPAVSVPTIDPNTVGTLIMQTAFAASTRTQAAIPSATPTLATPTPRSTDTPEPTATNTVVFLLFSPTTNPLSGLSGLGITGGTTSDAFACKVSSVSPANGTAFSPRSQFDVTWAVVNIGRNTWEAKDTNYLYLSGDKIHKVESYKLKGSVDSGTGTTLTVEMIAPKASGSYNTIWALKSGTTTFCPLTLSITVK